MSERNHHSVHSSFWTSSAALWEQGKAYESEATQAYREGNRELALRLDLLASSRYAAAKYAERREARENKQ